jgi:hypothetical protein
MNSDVLNKMNSDVLNEMNSDVVVRGLGLAGRIQGLYERKFIGVSFGKIDAEQST